MKLVLVSGLAFVVSALTIRFVLLSPRIRDRIVAAPMVHRWHENPTPSYGGIPMFIAVVAAVLVGGGFGEPLVAAILLGAGVLFVTGWLDDVKDISPISKLSAQVIAALATVVVAGPGLELNVLEGSVIVAWLVLMANSVNLLDNMDGLAGGTSLASLIMILPIVIAGGQNGLAIVVTAVAGAVAGFLVYNKNPAKVFMGDTGSLWLGLTLAATVAFAGQAEFAFAPLAAATVLAVPLVDTATVVYSRVRDGRSITIGGRDHLSHRLVRLGLSDKEAVLALNLAAVVCGAIGVSTAFLPTMVWALAVVAVWTALMVAAGRLLRVPVYQKVVR